MPFEQLDALTYSDRNIFDQETKKIFEAGWLYVGHVNQILEPGEHIVFEVANESIIILRTNNGDIKSYFNLCPHRGVRLLEASGNCKKGIVCPYHAWTFSLDGELLGIPAQKHYLPDEVLANHQLHQVRLEVWRGLIFISLNDAAPPLMSYLADFPAYLDDYHESIEDLHLITTVVMEEPINWKLIVENYVEDYHFSFVHPQTLKVFDHRATKTLPTGDHIRVFMPYETRQPGGECKYLWAPDGGSQQGFIWPSMTIQPAINHLSIFQIIALSPTQTRIKIPVYQTTLQQQKFPLDIEKLTADVLMDMEEDFLICRELQKNTRSRHFKIGTLSMPHELGISHFAKTWRKHMGCQK